MLLGLVSWSRLLLNNVTRLQESSFIMRDVWKYVLYSLVFIGIHWYPFIVLRIQVLCGNQKNYKPPTELLAWIYNPPSPGPLPTAKPSSRVSKTSPYATVPGFQLGELCLSENCSFLSQGSPLKFCFDWFYQWACDIMMSLWWRQQPLSHDDVIKCCEMMISRSDNDFLVWWRSQALRLE